MAVKLEKWQSLFGIFEIDGSNLLDALEKPVHTYSVNTGVYVVSRSLTALMLDNTYFDRTALFDPGISKGLDLAVYPLHGSWIDIGRPDNYEQASSHIKDKSLKLVAY